MGPILSYPRNVSKQIKKKEALLTSAFFYRKLANFVISIKIEIAYWYTISESFNFFMTSPKKIMTCSNYIEHLVLWPKFGKSIGISMREVIINDLIRKTTFLRDNLGWNLIIWNWQYIRPWNFTPVVAKGLKFKVREF